MENDCKQTAAAVFRFLEQRAPQGRTRTHRTEVPGQLDFSTSISRGCIIHHDAAPTRDEIHAIIQRHHADNDTGKAMMVFTTAGPRIDTRSFPLVPIFHLAPDGTVTPWNRRARILTPRTPQQQARRRVIARVLFGVVAVALVLVAGATVMGATSGTIRTVGIAVLVVCALAVLGVVGSILEATGWTTRRK
ncbi:hypothetical protein [Rhodococcus zopfii]|uniref:hypothetical protein n=1 Tax=Rhodococcus zopfii TaxID=43772 RepID=UPI000933441A|nr:hypothetical protein [Rhodococcus zopfii]